MFKRNSNKTSARAQAADRAQTLAHGAEDAASRVSNAVGSAGSRVAKGAESAGETTTKRAGEATDKVTKHANDAGDKVSRRARRTRNKLARQRDRASHAIGPGADALLKAQLAKTTRDLSNESSELRDAVDSLNAVIKSNRKSGAAARTRLIGGLAIGAALTYHLDAEHGRERRAATARRISGLVGSR